jgi:hypothetical protein
MKKCKETKGEASPVEVRMKYSLLYIPVERFSLLSLHSDNVEFP